MTRDIVWIIGAGLMQLPIINAAKTRGYQVMVTDRDPHAVGIQDHDFYQLDTYDLMGHLALAERLQKKRQSIVACIAVSIDVGHVAAAVSDYLGLTSVSYTVARKLGSKVELRESYNHGHPSYLIGTKPHYAAELWMRWFKQCNYDNIHPLPCIIKAADNCGSRGVYKVNDLDEFAEAVIAVQQHYHDDDRILIEECLKTDMECSSDWFVTRDQRVIQVNGAKRIFDTQHFGLEIMYTNPWVAPESCHEIAKRLVVATNFTYGPLKIDFMHDTRYGWCLTEAAARWSGGFDHNFAQVLSCSRDLTSVVLDWALGNEIDESILSIPESHRWSCGMSPIYKPGKITGWQLPTIDNTHAYIIDRDFTEIPEPLDCGARPIFVIADGDTETDAIAHTQNIVNQVAPIYA